MALDIFSRFDDHNKIIISNYILIWIVVVIMTIFPLQKIWIRYRSKFRIITKIINITFELTKRTNIKNLGNSNSLIYAILYTLILLNIWGLTPYVFRLTRHLAINLSLALILWINIVIIRITFNLTDFLRHLQPSGSPALLNPFLCLIELVSLLVRPLTLAVRLTANLRTGHILIGLLGIGFINSRLYSSLFILILGRFYFIFEIAVCVIQAYIFRLLPTLYADEHPSN